VGYPLTPNRLPKAPSFVASTAARAPGIFKIKNRYNGDYTDFHTPNFSYV
jgi:hypothetical protein